MPPAQVVYGTPTIKDTDTDAIKQDKYLKYLWKFVPGLATESDFVPPHDSVKQQFYDGFLRLLLSEMIRNAFNDAFRTYGYPWTRQYDSAGGYCWARTFARAAHRNLYCVPDDATEHDDFWKMVKESIQKDVFGSLDGTFKKYLDVVFRDARLQTNSYVRGLAEMKKLGPQEFAEEAAKRQERELRERRRRRLQTSQI
jgi:hypothetical protein